MPTLSKPPGVTILWCMYYLELPQSAREHPGVHSHLSLHSIALVIASFLPIKSTDRLPCQDNAGASLWPWHPRLYLVEVNRDIVSMATDITECIFKMVLKQICLQIFEEKAPPWVIL